MFSILKSNEQMKSFVITMLLFMICFFIMMSLSISDAQTNWKIKDCTWSEISPDYTIHQKQDCRLAKNK